MGRFATSWEIVKASGRVMMQDKELLVLPMLSLLASLVTLALIAGIGFRQGVFPNVHDAQGNLQPLALVLMGITYLALAFVNVYFAAAVVAGASQRLAGGNPTIGSSLAAAGRRIGRLFAWAVITATVSILLQIVRERGGLAGKIVASLGGIAWNLATYFMIPVLLFEETPLKDSIGRAGALFKRTWGETVIGNGGVGLVFMVAAVPVILIAFLALSAFKSDPLLGIALFMVAAVAFIFVSILQSLFQGIYKAALYRYATSGQVPAGFNPSLVQGAFVPK